MTEDEDKTADDDNPAKPTPTEPEATDVPTVIKAGSGRVQTTALSQQRAILINANDEAQIDRVLTLLPDLVARVRAAGNV